jgi:nitrite reductase/ring-hydroxylating ferredoxin subunit
MTDDYTRVTELSLLPFGTGKVFRVHGRLIALFRVNGAVYALDNACSHRDGPLGEGTLDGSVVTCPRHGWQFDVVTGACAGRPGRNVASFPTRIEGDTVLVQLPFGASRESSMEVESRLLVRFGAMGYVGRFRSTGPLDVARGHRVVVESSRGLEIGEVLWCGNADSELVENQPDSGTVVRSLTDVDIVQERLLREAVPPAFDACRQLLEERRIPVELIDAEQLFDGQTIVFYFLGDAPAALADITSELAGRFAAHVQFRPFGDHVPDDCGSCGHDGADGCGSCASDGACGREHCGKGCDTEQQPTEPS